MGHLRCRLVDSQEAGSVTRNSQAPPDGIQLCLAVFDQGSYQLYSGTGWREAQQLWL